MQLPFEGNLWIRLTEEWTLIVGIFVGGHPIYVEKQPKPFPEM